MLDYASFSAIRLANLFPPNTLPAHLAASSSNRSYDVEWYGGQWNDEEFEGAFLHYPKVGNGDLAAAEAWAGPNAQAPRALANVPHADSIWTANANRLLNALGLPVKIGSPQAEIRALTAERINALTHADILLLNMRVVEPDSYYMTATLTAADGLLTLAVYRADLMKKGCSKSAWKMFVGPWE